MSAPDPAVLDRVRKLLALSTSPNVHEAAAAAARAQALIARHRLDAWLAAEAAAEDSADPITDGREAPLEVCRKVRKWKGVLASVLAEANGCVAWVRGLGPREQALCVIGREADREWVRALWEDLVPRVEWLSATAGPGEDRAWHESFRIGAADAIAARLRAGAAEAHQALSATALATVDPHEAAHQQALDRFVDRHLGRARGRSIRVDADGLQRGRAAAAALPLPRSE